MEYVEARLILISVHATPAGPPRNLRASCPTLEREVAVSGVGDEGGGESKERKRERMKEKRKEDSKREGEKEHKRRRLTGDRRKKAEEGGEIGLARRTFHGRRERPSGVALCHIQPPTTVGSPSFK